MMRIATLALALLLLPPAAARAQRVDISHLDKLAEMAEEVVNVTLDAAMLRFASAFIKGDDPKQLAAKEFISGLSGIYVRVFEFGGGKTYSQSDLDTIRKQLGTPGWMRLVGVESKRDREIVDVFMWQKGDQPGGMVIIVAEPDELVFVNIVGPIDFSKLGLLEGQFGIPKLPVFSTTPPPGKE